MSETPVRPEFQAYLDASSALREIPELWSVTVPASPDEVAQALRLIGERIERSHLTLIGLWSTGFGDPSEAVLQVVTTREVRLPAGSSGTETTRAAVIEQTGDACGQCGRTDWRSAADECMWDRCPARAEGCPADTRGDR
jgi:hypothetical protein